MFQYIICVGSSLSVSKNRQRGKEFQYIICVGSRPTKASLENIGRVFQYIICVGSRKDEVTNEMIANSFQYIICVGSRPYFCYIFFLYMCFNTSYVSVQGNLKRPANFR